jgi:hypothetical protein
VEIDVLEAVAAKAAEMATRWLVPSRVETMRGLVDGLEPTAALAVERYRDWPQPIEEALRRVTADDRRGPEAAVQPAQCALMLTMVERLPARLRRVPLPPGFGDEYARCAARINARISEGRGWTEGSDDDRFRKDLALLTLRLLPCVSHVVCRSGLPRRTLLRVPNLLRGRSARVLLAFRGRTSPMLENHVHPDMLDRFNTHGRAACYGLVAQLLRQRPQMLGLLGTSWYYDAAVGRISPHLAYLRDGPAGHGAIFLDAPTSADSVRGALARSRHRRALHEAGRYTPRNETMVWPRRNVLESPFAGQDPSG